MALEAARRLDTIPPCNQGGFSVIFVASGSGSGTAPNGLRSTRRYCEQEDPACVTSTTSKSYAVLLTL
jgi:hypothetical protein